LENSKTEITVLSAVLKTLKEKGFEIRNKSEARIFKNKMFIWDNEKRLEHSRIMGNIVKENPEQYLGRFRGRKMRTFKDIDYLGNSCTHLGTWEKLIADLLSENGIHWLKEPHSFNYEFENITHLYYPDFYLPDYDFYIEVKGYETEKDKAKWENFPAKLFIIKGDKIIRQLKLKKINIIDLLKIKP
jgi:hypothetical protein